MAKYRIFDLAREMNTTSKILIDILARNGVVVRNHAASIGDEEKRIIDRAFAARSEKSRPVRNGRSEERPARPVKGSGEGRPQRSGSGDRAVREARPAETVRRDRPSHAAGGTRDRDRRRDTKPPAAPRLSLHGRVQEPAPVPRAEQPLVSGPAMAELPPVAPAVASDQPVAVPPEQYAGGPTVVTDPGSVDIQTPPPGSAPPAGDTTTVTEPPAAEEQVIIKDKTQKPADADGSGRPGRKGREKTDKRGADKIERREKELKLPPRGRQTAAKAKQQPAAKGKPVTAKGRPPAAAEKPAPPTVRPKKVKLPESITVKDLSVKFGREVNELIKKLMMLGVMAGINQEVDFDTASILAAEFGVTVEALPPEADLTRIEEIIDDPADLVIRPPVVTVMGHVDHGKTSLLDAIRKTKVTSTEAGGITQHIGAYQVSSKGRKICFLDTPGHEAFTSMRARGAQVTDIAILVVAADDGVMPQTVEAINHAKAANVPIIVAINKIDKEGANPERIKQQLTEYGLVGEEWGGDVIMVPVSAKAKTGIDELLEMILLVAEVQELKANPNRRAMGTVIEAQLDKGRGPVATILVQKGTLNIGDTVIAGMAYGKVRAMINDRGEKVKKAEPSTPVEVLGLSDVPAAGDTAVVVDERTARMVAEKRIAQRRMDEMKQKQKISLEDLFDQIKAGEIKDLNIVVKADVQGSIEALRQALQNLTNKEVRVNIVHAGVGAISESDIMLAAAANALVIGFNVRPDNNARRVAESESVDVRLYRVIYEAINDVEAAMSGMLAPEFKEVVIGRVEVRQTFNTPKTVVAGCYVLEGKITNSSQIRIIRDNIVVHEGKVESLRRFKDDVREVAAGYECGVSIEKYRDIRINDILEVFTVEEVKRG